MWGVSPQLAETSIVGDALSQWRPKKAGRAKATISIRSSYDCSSCKISSIGRLRMARTSTARKQTRKTKAQARKVVRRSATPSRIDGSNRKRLADQVYSKNGVEKATGPEAGKDHHASGVPSRATDSPAGEAYSHAMGTAVRPLQFLLALPYLSLQIWQNAVLGFRRLER
jgi:hypothetical protein